MIRAFGLTFETIVYLTFACSRVDRTRKNIKRKPQGVGGDDGPKQHGGGRGGGADKGFRKVERKYAMAARGSVGGVLLVRQQRILERPAYLCTGGILRADCFPVSRSGRF